MAEEIAVTTLKYHTHAGQEHQPGDVYTVEADDVANLAAQGMAVPETDARAATAVPPSPPIAILSPDDVQG
jgi:hypothetical protein